MIKLRPFSLIDLDQILKIEKDSFPKNQAYSKSRFKKYYHYYPETFIVAENGKEILGYGIGKAGGLKSEIISLAVKPGFREKGIGEKIALFLIRYCQKKGGKTIYLEVGKKNKTAIVFYKNLGFRVLQTIKNYYANGDDAILMMKDLN
jgi:ribosomal-protein-alanine N-acetyltransferase